MRHNTLRSTMAGLFVAITLVLLSLNYTSPTAQRTFSPRALGLVGFTACSTQVTMPLVGPSYSKPDSMILSTFLWSTGTHSAPKCSIFFRGAYGSVWNTGEWGPWTFQFVADSGVEFNEIGRPWASYDFLWVKVKSFGPDSMVFSMTSKFIGNITTNLLVPAPELLRLPLVNHETMDANVDIFDIVTASTADTVWLPLAWQRTKPLYLLSSAGMSPNTTVVTCATDSLGGFTGQHTHPGSKGRVITFVSNAAHAWYSYP